MTRGAGAVVIAVLLAAACGSSKTFPRSSATTSTTRAGAAKGGGAAQHGTGKNAGTGVTAPKPTTTTPPATAAPPPPDPTADPTIIEFSVTPTQLTCAKGEGQKSVDMHFHVANATSVTVGSGYVLSYPVPPDEQTLPTNVPCNGKAQVFELAAYGASGTPVTASVTVKETITR